MMNGQISICLKNGDHLHAERVEIEGKPDEIHIFVTDERGQRLQDLVKIQCACDFVNQKFVPKAREFSVRVYADEGDAPSEKVFSTTVRPKERLKYILDDKGMLTVTGKGEMSDYIDICAAPWYKDRQKIRKVDIANGITGIGENAFAECENLESVTIPSSVTSIGENAFRCCSKLTEVYIPSVEYIGKNAFCGCTKLANVFIAGVRYIHSGAFCGCFDLKNIGLPRNIVLIGESAFEGCNALQNVYIDGSEDRVGCGTRLARYVERDNRPLSTATVHWNSRAIPENLL